MFRGRGRALRVVAGAWLCYIWAMNFRAEATFRAGSFAALEAIIVPKINAAVTAATNETFQASQELVPVDTGELKGSGRTSVEWVGHKVTGYVEYTAPHAAYVEFGTGIRGSQSAGAGPVHYDFNWPGMVAQPYIRPAIDEERARIPVHFREQGFQV